MIVRLVDWLRRKNPPPPLVVVKERDKPADKMRRPDENK